MRNHLKTARPVAQLRKGRTDWYRIENSATESDTTDVYVYDEIGYFGVSAQMFVAELASVNTARITLRVNSPGGDVFDGIAIYNTLKNHPATVTARVEGLAASAASFIVQAADTIVMERNAQMMIHDASGLCIGNAADMAEMTNLLDKASDNIADIYSQRAGGTVDEWRAVMKGEQWYTADEAVAAGLADEVASAAGATAENSWDLSIFNYRNRAAAPAPKTHSVQPEPVFTFDPDAFRQAMKEVTT